jgi:hypothetical protein
MELNKELETKYSKLYYVYQALHHEINFDDVMQMTNEMDNSWIYQDIFKTIEKADKHHYSIIGFCFDRRFEPVDEKDSDLDTAIIFEDEDGNQYYDHVENIIMHDWRQQLSCCLNLTKFNTDYKFTGKDIDTLSREELKSWNDYFRDMEN